MAHFIIPKYAPCSMSSELIIPSNTQKNPCVRSHTPQSLCRRKFMGLHRSPPPPTVLTWLLSDLSLLPVLPSYFSEALNITGDTRPTVPSREIKIRNILYNQVYCHTCHIYRPPRTSHCSICDNCIGEEREAESTPHNFCNGIFGCFIFFCEKT